MLRFPSLSLIVLLLGPAALAADPAPATAPTPPPPPKWYDTFEVHGLVDASFSSNLSQAQTDGNLLRAFDGANGFQIVYAKLTAQASFFHLDLGFGPTAGVLNFKPASAGPPAISDVTVQQAYATVKLGDVVVDAGKVVTNTGAEVIEAKDNWLYSRSLLFSWAIPLTHTGLRATIPIGGVEGLSLMASLFNGFDNPPKPVSALKMGHLALMYSGPSGTTVTLNALYGRDPGATDDRLLLDAVLARSFGDLSVNLNGDYGKVGGKSYYGVALMARYSLIGDKLRVTARGEYLGDPDGLAIGLGDVKVLEGTLGLSVPVGSNVELRAEGRYDHADQAIFKAGASQGQATVQFAALAWF